VTNPDDDLGVFIAMMFAMVALCIAAAYVVRP
jgi:hypothetical protein